MKPDEHPPEATAPSSGRADEARARAPDAQGHHGPAHTHCQNCGTKLHGPYCQHCGQHDFDFHRSFGHIVLELLEDFFHFDAKFFRTLLTLLFRPGHLSAEFNAGKRAAQVPPFRLYIFVSFLFFFVSYLNFEERNVVREDGEEPTSQTTAGTLERLARMASDPARKASLARAAEILRQTPEAPSAKPKAPGEGKAAATPNSVEVAPGIKIALHEDQRNAFTRYLTEKATSALSHPQELKEAFQHTLPKGLLFCLPFFSLYTWVLFRRKDETYLHHLVVALHFHTFIYLWWLVAHGWVDLLQLASPTLAGWLNTAILLWLCLYPALMLRTLYGESWIRTIFKGGVLAIVYAVTLGFGVFLTTLVVFATL